MNHNPRRWFQIHLSTALALMFSAAGILYLNVSPIEEIWTEGSESTRVTSGKVAQLIREKAPLIDFTEDGHFYRKRHFGWPFVTFFDGDRVRFQSGEWEARSHWRDLEWDMNLYVDGKQNFAFNVLCWVGILAAIVWLARYLERRPGAQLHPATLVAGVIVAMFLVLMNWPRDDVFKDLYKRKYKHDAFLKLMHNSEWPRYLLYVHETYAGWPNAAWVKQEMIEYQSGLLTPVTVAGFSNSGWISNSMSYNIKDGYPPSGTYNACVWLAVLFTTCGSCEIIMRRRFAVDGRDK